MRKLTEVLRLKFEGNLTNRQIARCVNISASTVSYYFRGFISSGLTWPLPKELAEQELIQQLQPHCQQLKVSTGKKAKLDLAAIHQTLKQHPKTVTLQLLWEEYQQQHGKQAYSYSEFCRQYRTYIKKLQPTLRQRYCGGEKCFIDYAGPKVKFINKSTGEIVEAVLFVGVLGASNYTYVEATLTRSLPDWIGAQVRMFNFFGGVPEILIPDNEKSGVKEACYYDPEVNPHYAFFASHYNTVVLPTRPGKPQDKAKVEAAVQFAERVILGHLRHQIFYSLDELNQAIWQLLKKLNEKPFKKLPGNRVQAFAELDKPNLKPLPRIPYVFTTIKRVQVRLDYHVEIDGHYYSVPHTLIGQIVEYRLTARCVEIYHLGNRMASHVRAHRPGGTTTQDKHLPSAHRVHQHWSPQSFVHFAEAIGAGMLTVAKEIIQAQPHPECCYRIHNGFRNLLKRYGKDKLEQACQVALIHSRSQYRFIRNVLENKLENQTQVPAQNQVPFTSRQHKHLRGSEYYRKLNLTHNPKES